VLFSGIARIGLWAAPNKGLPETQAAFRIVITAHTAPRIASLVPSLTELLFELGLGPCLVARTGFCIHPRDAVSAVPKVGGTKDVNLAKLRRLAPTHVIVNIDENRRETVDAIRAWSADDGPPAPQVIVTHPLAPDDNLALVGQLLDHFGALDGVAERAERFVAALRRELEQTRPDARPAQRVLYLIWRDPWMTVARDTYIARMLDRVNWQTVPAVDGGASGAARYPVVRGDEAWLAQVDQVLLSSEPYAFGAPHLTEAQALCPNARVRLVDGEMLSWYGARAVPGLRYLRQIAESLPR
jgi:ABC-type Fe3+-hydroxamate transport system substrate-binding protein